MTDSGGWNTIESDAGVFTYLIEKLGVQNVQFEELVTLELEELLQLSPVYGVIFLFKYPTDTPSTPKPTSSSSSPQPLDGTYDEAASSTLFFAAQTIQNACATQAILSILLNHHDTIPIGPTLTSFLSFTSSFPPSLRGETLTNSPEIRTAHNSFARASPFISDPLRPASPSSADDVYHFIAYTPINNTLYELDGLHPAPISHGPLPTTSSSSSSSPSTAFATALLPVLQRRIARHDATEIRFNLLALCGDLRAQAAAAGDAELLAARRRQRREWRVENALRAWNALGFAAQVLRGVVAQKVKAGEGAFEEWVKGAEEEGRRRAEGGRARKGGAEGAGAGDGMDVDG